MSKYLVSVTEVYRVDSENKRVGHYNGKTKTSILIHNGLITVMLPKNEKQSKEDTISFKKEKTKQKRAKVNMVSEGESVILDKKLFYKLIEGCANNDKK